MKTIKKIFVVFMAAISLLASMLLFVGCKDTNEKNYTIDDLFNADALCAGFITNSITADVDYMTKVETFTNKEMPINLNDDKKTQIEDLKWGSAIILFPTEKATEVTITKISYTSYRVMRNDEKDNGRKEERLMYAQKNGADSFNQYLKLKKQELSIDNAMIYPKENYNLWTYNVSFDVNIKFEEAAKTKDGFNGNSTWADSIENAVSSLKITASYYSTIANLKIEFTYNK